MGLFGSKLEKLSKVVVDKHKQSVDRFAAMEKLKEMGSDEALYALARRFSYVYDKTIEDEQEKDWTYQTFVELGAKSLAPVRRYTLHAESVAWPLRVLEKIASNTELLEVVDKLL